MAPETPTWDELGGTNDRRAVLMRACLYTLARSPSSNLSALELTRLLPELGVGQSVQLVRETLRNSPCFYQPFKGRWQVGRAVRRLE